MNAELKKYFFKYKSKEGWKKNNRICYYMQAFFTGELQKLHQYGTTYSCENMEFKQD